MPENGQKKSVISMEYKCPICKDTGFELYEDEKGYSCARECKCGLRKREVMNNKLKFAALPSAFVGTNLDNFKTDIYKLDESVKIINTDMKAVRYWLSNYDMMKQSGIGLYFYSQTKGSGKTRLAVSIANELIEKKNVSVKFTTSIQLIDEIKATWDKGYEFTEHQLLEDLSNAEVLIIDDFGAELAKPWIMERFYQVINNRYISNRITIFTSNMNIDSLEYDDRITNRIKERSYTLAFPEESIREQIYKNNMAGLVAAIA